MNQQNVKDLPHDLISERAVVSSLPIDSSCFDQISDLKLKKEDFFHPQYAMIFEAICDLIISHQPVDYSTLSSKLNDFGRLESIGGTKAIIEMIEDQVSSANVYAYSKSVKDKASIRELVRTSMRITDRGLNYQGKAEDFIQEVEASFF